MIRKQNESIVNTYHKDTIKMLTIDNLINRKKKEMIKFK